MLLCTHTIRHKIGKVNASYATYTIEAATMGGPMIILNLLLTGFGALAGLASSLRPKNPHLIMGYNYTLDLNYTEHLGIYHDDGDYFTFLGLRYAEPPLGERRFRPPVPLSTVNRTATIENGHRRCPQGFPNWLVEKMAVEKNETEARVRERLERQYDGDEDCLVLDVSVARETLDAAIRPRKPAKKDQLPPVGLAPVVIWISGRGFVAGEKREEDPIGNPQGLMKRALAGAREGIVFVAINYRLGLFGWLNVKGDEHIVPNVGLLDQREAMKWVRKYIHFFGGDPDNVTVMGDSSGGGSIMHHLTARDGNTSALFHRAIIQSPSFATVDNAAIAWKRTRSVAKRVAGRKIRTGADLAGLSYKALKEINSRVIGDSPVGTFSYGPSIDGDYVTDIPGVLLLHGKFDKSPKLMIGHTTAEGEPWMPPRRFRRRDFDRVLKAAIPGLGRFARNQIMKIVYPPPESTDLYRSQGERMIRLVSELVVTCNTRYLATAWGNKTWNYRFEVRRGPPRPSLRHMFHNGTTTDIDVELAAAMQQHFVNFAVHGTPNTNATRSQKPSDTGLPLWPVYGEEARLATFGQLGFGLEEDMLRSNRCDYWQQGRYRPGRYRG